MVKNMLFEKEIRETEEKLYKKGYYMDNMVAPYNDYYEVYNADMKVVMDYLSVAQLVQLANILTA